MDEDEPYGRGGFCHVERRAPNRRAARVTSIARVSSVPGPTTISIAAGISVTACVTGTSSVFRISITSAIAGRERNAEDQRQRDNCYL